MRSGSPVLSEKTFADAGRTGERAGAMTVQGTINKTALLLLLVLVTASWTWSRALRADAAVLPWMYGGLIAGLVLALVTIFKKTWAPVTSPLYALAEGLFLGGFSCVLNLRYPGIAAQAVALTFGVLFVMLVVYKTRLIRVTQRFAMCVVAATGAIFVVYLVSFVLGMFGAGVPYIHGNGVIGIGFSLFVVVIAALNLMLDFALIEGGAERGAPKYMEWYGAFALMVTLVWLYINILRLLAKIRSRR